MAGIKYWLWLRNLQGLSNQTCLTLWEQFGSPERVYYADAEELAKIEGLSKKQQETLENKSLAEAEQIMEACASLGIHIVTIEDADYPDRLRAIENAPCVLYTKGTWPDFDSEAVVAIIGSRESTPYGIRIGQALGYDLSKGGAYVISGLAARGDTAGHMGAILAGCKTAAVLGCGIDVVYPRENARLYDDIEANGVLISEYPPGSRPVGNHFLERNRIISGLSLAVCVVEAKIRSGTQNTVRHALEQGRDVYAVPGPIDSPFSAGTNQMIREGAEIVTKAWDILEDLQQRFPEKIEAKLFPLPEVLDYPEHKKKSPAAPAAEPAEKPAPADDQERIDMKHAQDRFTDDQIKILLTLSDQPMIVDDITETTQIPVRRVLSALTELEIEEVIRQESGNRYILNAVIEQ